MHRFLSIASSLLALTALMSCDQSSPLDPSSAPAAVPASLAQGLVPWKESYEASGTISLDPQCATDLLLVSLEGGGTATHVGNYTITNSHCLDPSTGVFTDGVFVKTAANGDQLFGTYVGNSTVIQVPQPVGIFGITGTLSFNGGTGRFAGATGTVTMNGTLRADFSQPGVPVPAEASLVMIGSISSVGSTKH